MKLKNLTLALLLGFALSIHAANKTQRVTQCTTNVVLTEAIDYVINSTQPFSTAATIDIQNPDAAVVFENIRPSEVISNYLVKVTFNGVALVNNTNCRVSIYRHGAIVLPHSDTKNPDGTDFYPLTTYSGDGFTGEETQYNKATRYTKSDGSFPIRSFKLKRGYMVTMANNIDGSGYSHCFIANSEDRLVDLTQEGNGKGAFLADKVGFFRIFRWQWPGKLGMSDARDDQLINLTNASWFYDWGAGNSLRDNAEYVPQRHHEAGQSNGQGYKGAWQSFDVINGLNNTNTHILGQNEPDNESGAGEVYTYITAIPDDPNKAVRDKHADYPLIDVAKDFLYSGMRIGTFACCNPNTGWVTKYLNWCKENNVRVDFIATHYYVGGTDPAGCISRLKALHDAAISYNEKGLPVWATEWNNGANWTTEGGFSTDGGWYSWGSGNDQQKNGEWLRDVLKRADNEKWLERLAVYNAVEGKREIWTNGAPTKAAEVLGTYKSGFAYDDENEAWMPWTYKEPTDLTATYNIAAKQVTLTWVHKNSKQSNAIRIQRKVADSSRYSTLGNIGIHEDGTLTYTDDASELSGAVMYRICDADADGTTRYSNEVTVDIAPSQGTEQFQYGTSTISSTEEIELKFSTTLNVKNSSDICIFLGSMTSQNSRFYAGNYVSGDYSANQFKFKLIPWVNNTGSISTNEELPFIVHPIGNYKYGELDCEVGAVDANTASSNKWTDVTEVTFQQPFPEGVTPIVLTEIRKPTSSSYTYCTRVFDITNTGFKFIIYPDAGSTSKVGRVQTVCYMAITPGIGMMDEENGIMIAAGQGIDEDIYGSSTHLNYLYAPTFDEIAQTTKMEKLRLYQPTLLTALQTNNYPAVSMLRRTNVEETGDGATWTTGFKLKRILDRDLTVEGTTVSRDTEDAAYHEKVGWVAIATYKEGGSEPTGIEDVSADPTNDSQKPRIVDGRVYVDGANSFKIFNVTGAPVPIDNRLAPGIYMIYVNGKSFKILVK